VWPFVSASRCVEVSLTIPDNEARTALGTLQRLGVHLSALERADLYRCELEEPAAARLDEMFRSLEPVFNPNKHALRIREGDRPLPGEVWVEELESSDESIRRTDAQPGESVRIAGRTLPGVHRVKRAVAWRIFDVAGAPAGPETVRRATELLCNPAFQKATTS
jgi:hypothetical protein